MRVLPRSCYDVDPDCQRHVSSARLMLCLPLDRLRRLRIIPIAAEPNCGQSNKCPAKFNHGSDWVPRHHPGTSSAPFSVQSRLSVHDPQSQSSWATRHCLFPAAKGRLRSRLFLAFSSRLCQFKDSDHKTEFLEREVSAQCGARCGQHCKAVSPWVAIIRSLGVSGLRRILHAGAASIYW